MSDEKTKNDVIPGLGVYKAIAAVQAELAKDGISKGRKNKEQGYSFRGIDDVYNAMAPLLSQNGLCILPRILAREFRERVNAKGTAIFYVVVNAEFDFVSAIDGSRHTVVTFGEAMDTADKATNKAMSAAYKYACLQAFCIPTEGDNDADATTHEVKAKSAFENPAVRQMFLDNTSMSFDKAETVEALNELVSLAKPKANEMRASGDREDVEVADALRQRYLTRLKFLNDQKPATVEDAMKSKLDGVLGNDQIPV